MYRLVLIKDGNYEILGVFDNIDFLILSWLLLHQYKDGSFWVFKDSWNGFAMKLFKKTEE